MGGRTVSRVDTIFYGQTDALRKLAGQDTYAVWNWNLNQDPNDPNGWLTNVYATMAVQIDQPLLAGDIIDVNLEHEVDNENTGAGAWTVNGVQSEHWYAWAMVSTSVYLGTATNLGSPGVPLPSGGTRIMTPKETNWDWLIHHLPISRNAKYKCTTGYAAGMWVYDRVYFKAGKSYMPAGRVVQVNARPYCQLTVEVRRPGA